MKNHDDTNCRLGAERGPWVVRAGTGRVAVELILRAQGDGLLIQVTGGRAHIGAVAVCDCRLEKTDGQTGKGTIQLSGHREGPLAAEAAETLAAETGQTCAAVVGIHQEAATPAEIRHIVSNVRQGLQQLITTLNEGVGKGESQ